jgi:hypothetical protein
VSGFTKNASNGEFRTLRKLMRGSNGCAGACSPAGQVGGAGEGAGVKAGLMVGAGGAVGGGCVCGGASVCVSGTNVCTTCKKKKEFNEGA